MPVGMGFMWIIGQLINLLFGLSLFVNAALFIPQIIRIVRTKQTAGLSLVTFFGFCLIQLATIAHGLLVGDYLLAFGYVLSVLTCGTVTALIIFHR